jgi:hypothetical protein
MRPTVRTLLLLLLGGGLLLANAGYSQVERAVIHVDGMT